MCARLAKLDQRREKLMDLALDGPFGKDEIARRAASLDEERDAAKAELERLSESAGRAGEMERAKRAVPEMFGTGLMLGVAWFPPRLRREIYGLLGLRVEVHQDRTLRISGTFDADLMRRALGSPEVQAYVAALREVQERPRDPGPAKRR